VEVASIVGLDLAKSVFQAHAADASGGVLLRKKLRRSQVLAFFSAQPRYTVAMEACGSAHHWAREISKLGHHVRLKRQKTDAADAEAIWEAAQSPTMRFMAPKSEDAQAAAVVFRSGAPADPDHQCLAAKRRWTQVCSGSCFRSSNAASVEPLGMSGCVRLG
jgi:transposase